MHLNPIQTVLCITVDGIIGVVTLPFVSSFTDFYIFVNINVNIICTIYLQIFA